MSQHPDQFFRDKLRDHSPTPPPMAWDRISSQLTRKRRAVPWRSIAASILVMVAVGAFLFLPRTDDTGTLADGTPAPAHNPPAQEKTVVPEPVQPATEESHQATRPTAARPDNVRVERSEQNTTRRAADEPKTEVIPPAPMQDENIAALPPVSHAVEEPVPVQPERITIVFTAQEVDNKYLKKKPARDATHEPEDASGIEKVLLAARDFKSNADPLGEIRQKKDELFALHFRNDKENNEAN